MSLFTEYIETMPEVERRAAGIRPGRVVPAPRATPVRVRWARARFTLAVAGWALLCLALTAAVVVGPAVIP